jgi:ankyrin repeat protein
MRKFYYILFICIYISSSCGEKKLAIDSNDTQKIKDIIKKKPVLLDSKSFYRGNSPLVYSMIFDKFISFKALIELGADVNFINDDKGSVLLNAIRYYETEFGLDVELKYLKILLEKGANPDYAIIEGFTNKNGGYIMPISPICKASAINVDIVKMLIEYEADYKSPIGGVTPFGFALKARKFDIINFYIDSLKIDLNQPVGIINTKPFDSIKIYYPKDYINKYFNFSKESSSYKLTKKLIDKLDSLESLPSVGASLSK